MTLTLNDLYFVNRELLIDASTSEVVIALLEEKQLVQLHKEKTTNNFIVGDLYLGKVKKINPGMNAAFIDVGHEKDAFLHYFDLGPQVKSLMKYTRLAVQGKQDQLDMEKFENEPDIEKTGKIAQVIGSNQHVLVQIAKEPISNKGPRITSEIAFAGRFLVLVPFSNRISVSQKIKNNEEKNRLKRLVQSIRPNNFGVIIRTVAENKKVAELVNDLNDLMEKWKATTAALLGAKAPVKIHSELNRSTTILRDLLNESFNSVVVNEPKLYNEIKNYIKTIAPDKEDIVKLYKGKVPLFEQSGLDKQIRNSFGKKVSLKNGSYLIIEHTEAMHVIDVNSGHRTKNDANQEVNALDVNLDAAKEVARQLRLRDMGGIIVVDFIDMHEKANRRLLYETLSEAMKSDHAKHTILPPSKFGLVQITRQRVRPELEVQILEKCPTCQGTGEIKASIMLIDEIENAIQYLIREQNETRLSLHVHPYIHAYLTKGFFSRRIKWFMRFGKMIKIIPQSSFNFLEFRFFNFNNEEIKI